jgi:hypothetical protein
MNPISTIRMRELHAVARELSLTHADIKEVVLTRTGTTRARTSPKKKPSK